MTTPRCLVRAALVAAISSLPGVTSAAQSTPDSSELDRPTDALARAAQDLVGAWEGTFRLDSAWGMQAAPRARSTPARLRFDPVRGGSVTPSTRSVHAGIFEIDFTAFGFEPATRDALGWLVGADSMRAVLNPTVDHGAVTMAGAVRGDTIAGTWRYTSDPGGAAGTFELRRIPRRQ